MAFSFKWLGHSAFSFDIDGHPVLIDPFLTGNPLAAAQPHELEAEMVLLSHAHGDHLGDTVEIARRTGAPVVTNYEIGNWMFEHGVKEVAQMNLGGSFFADFIDIKMTIAFHSSSFPDGTYGGSPAGFLISAPQSGLKVYYASDTALFSDMRMYGEEGIDVAFLPIGDFFTMGPGDSIKAINLIKPRFVVPMHYNTFPPIVQDVADWAKRVNAETNAIPIVLDPGNEHTVS